MLRELKIENLAIIDELDLEFEKGFAVLTGETGAGKSIILSGINLLVGEKASVDMIRDGEEALLAQGVFDINDEQAKNLEALGIESKNNEVIIRRYLNRNGKAKVFINNIRASMTELKLVMSNLVDIVGQHSHQMLLNKANHIKLLDSFLSKKDRELKEELAILVKNYKELEDKIELLEINKKEVLEKKEFYEYQLQEIEKLKLIENEDKILELEYKKAFNAEKIKEKVYEILNFLKNDDDSALDSILYSQRNLEYLEKYDKEYGDFSKRIENIYYELEDCVDSIEKLSQNLTDFDDNNLGQITRRMDALKRIKDKYKREIPELIAYREELRIKLSKLEDSDYEINMLKKELTSLKENYDGIAEKLNLIRNEIAKKLETLLLDELKFLNMENAIVKIAITKENKISQEGFNDVEFLISTNLGQNLKPLSKIASGGEVSRIMLALKVIFSKVDNIPILIFDEIDTGVGGETVRKIALKLKEIGSSTQIISITHSPVIASKANQQFFIEKYTKDAKTISRVRKLKADERIKEIGRMLVGEKITPDVLEIANKMLKE